MKLTILGSGGCTVIPRPLCRCRICQEARENGTPYIRTGPSAFIHDENILIDTPAEIPWQLDRSRIGYVDNLVLTHLDPDHVEGLRVVEQIALDYRTWRSYPERQINLILPDYLYDRLKGIRSVYGSLIDFYENQGLVKSIVFVKTTRIGKIDVTAIPVNRDPQISTIYVFEADGRKIVYAPCDIKPFPEEIEEVKNPDLLVIQPGIFEEGLKHGFTYPKDHISRITLYTFNETMSLAERIHASRVLFVHLEEYWNRSYDDYLALQKKHKKVQFAYDGMSLTL